MDRWLNLAALHHYLFEVAAPLNIVVTLVYWAMLHGPTMQNPFFTSYPLRLQQNTIVHIVPLAVFVASWLISDVIMPVRHYARSLPVSFAYLLANYVWSKKTG